MSKIIELTQNKQAIVDDEDYEILKLYKWCFSKKSKHGHGYAQRGRSIRLGFKQHKTIAIYMHREILVTDQEVDHINSNTLDNRRENLRIANRLQQSQNTSSRKNSSSQYVGVHIHKITGKWRAQITVNGKIKDLGLFPSQESARDARNKFISDNHLERFKR